jgi:hypothetical protein
VQRGELDLDAPVVQYWPEFGAAGKDQIPVRWRLSHQAGLPVVDGPLTFEDACAWHPVIRALEAQKPEWQPGTEHETRWTRPHPPSPTLLEKTSGALFKETSSDGTVRPVSESKRRQTAD